MPVEEPHFVPTSYPSDYCSDEPSSLTSIIEYDMPPEYPILVTASYPNYYPNSDTSSVTLPFPYALSL